MVTQKQIGELNGKWSVLFKVTQVVTPIAGGIFLAVVIPWCVWVTNCLMILEPQNKRYGWEDHERFKSELWQEIEKRFDSLPPEVWQQRINRIEEQQLEMLRNQIKIMSKLDVK